MDPIIVGVILPEIWNKIWGNLNQSLPGVTPGVGNHEGGINACPGGTIQEHWVIFGSLIIIMFIAVFVFLADTAGMDIVGPIVKAIGPEAVAA